MNVSHCQNMTNTCNLEVYTENPFYLLGLSPFASNRTIRRKKQDFESANALGNKQWENEFNHLLGLRSVPTFDKVNETFLKLEDPRSRIIYEIFWFWPLDDNEDVASNLLHVGRVDDSMKIWAYEEQSTAPHRALIATHNIAVFYHLYAIDAERQFIKNNASSFFYPKEHKKMCDYWQKSLSRWEKLLNSSSFWDILQKRIKDIDDSRLTPQFIQQVRNELPCSLNRINANFVLEYAKRSDKKNEITRHITYVKDFYQGYDRIQSILESVIEPIERDINLMIRQAEQDCAAKPQNALSVAKHLFKSTKHPLGILSQIFESQNVKKCKIVDTIITVCNRCLVAYCNKTNKFEETILFLEEILPLANNLDLKKLLNDNLKIFKDNFEEYKLTHYCWFCQKHEAEPTYNINVEMYGDINIIPVPFTTGFRSTWRNATIVIPRCRNCSEHSRISRRNNNDEIAKAKKAIETAKNQRSGWEKFWDTETDSIKTAKKLLDDAFTRDRNFEAEEDKKKESYPLYKFWKKCGFQVGRKPSDWELQSLYHKQYPFGHY